MEQAAELFQGAVKLTVPRVAAGDPDEIAVFRARRKHLAGNEGDSVGDGFPVQGHGIDVQGKLQPEHESSLRIGHPRFRREVTRNGIAGAGNLVAEAPPQGAQMNFETTCLDELGDHLLRQWTGFAARQGLVQRDLRGAPAGGDEADAQGRAHRLGKRGAEHGVAAFIESMNRPWAFAGKTDIAVNVVFDQRDIARGEQVGNGLLAFIGNDRSQRVRSVGDEQASGHPAVARGQFERLDGDAGLWVGRDLQRSQAQGFK